MRLAVQDYLDRQVTPLCGHLPETIDGLALSQRSLVMSSGAKSHYDQIVVGQLEIHGVHVGAYRQLVLDNYRGGLKTRRVELFAFLSMAQELVVVGHTLSRQVDLDEPAPRPGAGVDDDGPICGQPGRETR